MGISVVDNAERQRFEALVDGELAGFADYRPGDGVLAFTHTEVDPAYRGKGVGAVLVGTALDQVRTDGHRVLPLCSFVADYVSHHPEYADLVARAGDDTGGA